MKAADHLKSLAITAGFRCGGLAHKITSIRPNNLLILGYAAIGDFIFFLPALEALRRHLPKARITFLANPSPVTREIVPTSGLADAIWLHDWEGQDAASDQPAINRRIHEARFDAVVLTLSSPAHYFQWGLRDIPLRVGHSRPMELRGWRNSWLRARRALITGEFARRTLLNGVYAIEEASEYAVSRNLRLLAAFEIPPPPLPPRPSIPLSDSDRSWAKQQLLALDPKKKKIGVHLGPVRNQYHKIWDHERFGRLCARLSQTWPVEFIVIGDPQEQEGLRRARSHHPLTHSWIGRCSLLQTCALIERCDLFLSNDTGPSKAAAALGIPTATLMGPSDPGEVGVPWEPEKHLNIRTGIQCSPCARLGMAKEGVLNYLICGHHDCLGKLEVDFVFEALCRKYASLFDN